MDSANSINAEFSPKHQLPTKRRAMAEVKPDPTRQWFCNDDHSPSTFQKSWWGHTFLYLLVVGLFWLTIFKDLTIVGIAIVWGVVLMALIYAFGHVSGAHFNPSVSIALAVAGKFSWKIAPMYILAQVLGATLATLTLKMLFHDQEMIQATVTQYSKSTSDLEALTWEMIITFNLMTTILAVATDHRASKDLCGIAIGGTLLVNVMIAGPITGASMNPARSLGPAVVSGVSDNLWVFIVAPTVGALAAVLVYGILRVPKPEEPEESSKISVF